MKKHSTCYAQVSPKENTLETVFTLLNGLQYCFDGKEGVR